MHVNWIIFSLEWNHTLFVQTYCSANDSTDVIDKLARTENLISLGNQIQ